MLKFRAEIPEDQVVDTGAAEMGGLTVGTHLTAVFYDEKRPKPEGVDVYAEAPFYVKCADHVGDRTFPGPALLLWKRGEEVYMADARAVHSEFQDSNTLVEMQVSDWTPCDDRRRSPRRPCHTSVALRLLSELDDNVGIDVVYGRCHDISMSGAYVEIARPVDVGQLVEFHTTITTGVVVKALGVIARRRDNPIGYGVAFLEFLGDGHDDLDRYLSQVA